MSNRIKDVVNGIKMKDSMQDEILWNLSARLSNRKTKSSSKKTIIAICSLTLVFIIGSGIFSKFTSNEKNEVGLLNNSLFSISVYAMEFDGNYSQKTLIPNIPEDVFLVSLNDNSKVCIFSLKEFKEDAYKDYYFDIYDAETNEDIDLQIDSTKFKGEDGSLNLIIDPNTIIIYPKESLTQVIIDAYDSNDKIVESMMIKIEESEENYRVEIIEHDKVARENNMESISIEKGKAIFAKVGTFKTSYELNLDINRFGKMERLPDEYTKDLPHYENWGEDKVTYTGYSLNNSEFTAESDIPFSADIYTMKGDMISSIKSIDENGIHGVYVKFDNKKYYIVLVNEDGKSTKNGNYSIWKRK